MANLAGDAGTEIFLDFGPVTRLGVPIDLTVAATKIWFTVKAKKSDADPGLIQKTYVAGGASNGIVVPSTGNKNTGTVTLVHADTAGLASKVFSWDLLVEEPGGRRTRIDKGLLKIRGAVSSPA